MRKRVQHPTGGEKLTQQHFAAEANINTIMERHLRTGGPLLGPGKQSGRQPIFTELTGQTYHEMLCKIQEVQGTFAALPAKIRKRFANNPHQLIRFLEDSNNLNEAISLGLVQREDLPPEKIQQLDLAEEAEKADLEEFREWQRKKRAGSVEPELEEETPVQDKKKPRK